MNPSRTFSSFSNSSAVFLFLPPSSFSSRSFTSDFPSLLGCHRPNLFQFSILPLETAPPSEFFGLSPGCLPSFPPSIFFFHPRCPLPCPPLLFTPLLIHSSFSHPFSDPSFLKFSLFSVFPFTPLSLSLCRSVFLNHLSVLRCDYSSLFPHVHASSRVHTSPVSL